MLASEAAASLLVVIAVLCLCSAEILTAPDFLNSACSSSESECRLAAGALWTVRSGSVVLPSAYVISTERGAVPSDVAVGRNATSSVAELSLAGQSGLFSVPANGSVELRGLRISDAALPSAPYPLPASSFLALSAFRLGAGARLRLVDSVLTVPSCALLSLHQTYACGLSPSPNVTVTPSSLVVHRLTTPSLDAWNVTVQCSGAAAPFPCLASSFPSDVPLISYLYHASQLIVTAFRTFGGTPPPVYVFLKQDTVLVESSGSTSSSSGSSTGGPPTACGGGSNGSSNTTTSGVGQQPQQGIGANPDAVGGTQRAPEPAAACASIAWVSLLVLAGDASAQPRTVLDLADSTSRLNLQIPDGKVEFRYLALRSPPPGPPGNLPYSLLRLPIWTVAFRRYLLGSKLENLLTLTDCTVELPPEEVATVMTDAGLAAAQLPPSLAGLACATDIQSLFTTRRYNMTLFTAEEVYIQTFIGSGTRSVYTRVRARAVWSAGAFTTTSQQQQQQQQQQQPGGRDLLGTPARYPSRPSLCSALAPGQPPPVDLGYVQPITAGLTRPWRLSTYGEDLKRGLVLRAVIALLGDAHLMSSADPFFFPSYGQAQSNVTVPSLVLGEPLSLRLLDFCGVSSAVVIAGGPRAALTLRWLVLVGLPAAGGLKQVPLGPTKYGRASPSPPSPEGQQPAPAPPPVLQGGGGELGESGHSVTGRRLQQRAQGQLSNGQGGSGGALGERRGLVSLTEGPQQREGRRLRQLTGGGSVTQGLAPALANFTSCLWAFDFDRSPQALAADAAGGVGGRPAGLPRLQLDGVVLVVPEAELQLLGRVWAASADLLSGRLSFSVDTDTGLAAAMMSLLQGSALLGPDSSSPHDGASLRSIGMLEFSEVTWCGWTGYNVTLITATAAELLDAIAALRADATSYGAIASAPVLEGLVLPAVEFTAPAAADSAGGGMTSGAMGGGVAVPSVSPPPAAAAVIQAANPPQQAQPLPTADRSATGPAAAASQQQPDQQQASGGSSTDAVGRLPAGAPAAGGGASAAGAFGLEGSSLGGSGRGGGVGSGSSGSGGVDAMPSEAVGGSSSKAVPIIAIVVSCVGGAAVMGGLLVVLLHMRRRSADRHYHNSPGGGKAAADSGLASAASAAGSNLLRPSARSGASVCIETRRDGEAACGSRAGGDGGSGRRSGMTRSAFLGSSLSTSQGLIGNLSLSEFGLRRSSCNANTGGGAASTAAGQASEGTAGAAGSGAQGLAAAGRLGPINRAVVGMLLAVEDGRRRVAQCESGLASTGEADSTARLGEVASAAGSAQNDGSAAASTTAAAPSSNSVNAGSNVRLLPLSPPSSTPVSARAQPATAAAAGLVVPPFCSSFQASNAVVTGTAADQASSLPLTITGELGRGAQGVVYRGVWRGLDVAVKSVLFHHSKGRAQDPHAKQAVEEAAIAVSMAHPNIVATYTYQLQPLRSTSSSHSSPVDESAGPSVALESSAVHSSNGSGGCMGRVSFLDNPEAEVWKLTLVQELCDANSLRHCLQSGRLARGPQAGVDVGAGSEAEDSTDGQATALQPVPARTVLLLACDIARGLAYLHERGVVHADLSSNNVLLQIRRSGAGTASSVLPSDTDVGFVAKLCDFGLSGRLEVEADATHLSGPARCSSAYSAPELVEHGRSGPAGDVYAFAVVLWELALGLPLPAALARPESAGLRTWLSEQARLAPAGDDTFDGAEGGDQAAGPPLGTLALPPGLLWWPEHTPPALKALAAECLQPEPRLRPGSAAVLARLEQAAQQEGADQRLTRQPPTPQRRGSGDELQTFWARLGFAWRART